MTRVPTRWRRICPGEYEGQTGWLISRIDYGYGPEWTARDGSGVALDPLPTLDEAKRAADTAAQETLA